MLKHWRHLITGPLMALAAMALLAGYDVAGADGLQITSPAFAEGETIPVRYTCQGEDISPPLGWSGVPEMAMTLALIVDDPDAPGGTWVHWVAYNLPPDTDGLTINASGNLPGGAWEGTNSWGRHDYGGPCPPSGEHRYRFKLYALDRQLELERPTRTELEAAMRGHVLAQDSLVGVYEKR